MQQKRIISVREVARAQGFPDDYTFCSINKANSQRMIDDVRGLYADPVLIF